MSALDLTIELISRPSVTPEDAGCQTVIAERLSRAGFEVEHLDFGPVKNLWARWGSEAPILCFAGHTDVVPTGPLDQWHSDPFVPVAKDEYLFGRGAADMKSGLAAMVTAAETFVSKNPNTRGSLAFLITSDEEGVAKEGTRRVMETLIQRGETIRWCIVGEPSSANHLGDTVRIGRRGSLTGTLTVHGIQGHVAYPDKARNPVHSAAAAISQLCETTWDEGNKHFPPTGFQIPLINAGTGATNVIPGVLTLTMNFRFSTESTAIDLRNRVEELLRDHQLDYDIDWHLSGNPFLTQERELIECVQRVVSEQLQRKPELSTAGGTSDGRFIAPTGTQVVELGVINKTIHQINECVCIDDINRLHLLYLGIMENMLCQTGLS